MANNFALTYYILCLSHKIRKELDRVRLLADKSAADCSRVLLYTYSLRGVSVRNQRADVLGPGLDRLTTSVGK